jgi:FKBP-type peptidyl-prolyl cis-trans isomerase
MKHVIFAVAGLALLSTAACKVNYDKTKSGLVYKVVSTKGGQAVMPGQIVKFNVEFKLSPKDSILSTTYGKFPGYTQVDTSKNTQYTFIELFPLLKVGDSVEFTMSVDTLKNRGMIPAYDSTFTRNGQIKGKLTVLGTFATEDMAKNDINKEVEKESAREIASLENYLNKKGIKAQRTKNGAFVEITTPGDPNLKADSGKLAMVMYRGYLQDGGKVFDTNMDTTKGHTDPIPVVVGAHRVIQGWDEALPYFSKGSKGKIYVPSSLGYGMRGAGQDIPANANLIFDIEVLDVKDAPPAQPEQQGGNPFGNLTPEQMKQLQEQMQQQRQQQQGSQPQQQAAPGQKK